MSVGILLTILAAFGVFLIVYQLLRPAPAPGSAGFAEAGLPKTGPGGYVEPNPQGSLWERLDAKMLKITFLKNSLERYYLLLGQPSRFSPVAILHAKQGTAFCAVLAGALLLGTLHPLTLLILALLGFSLPDLLFSQRIRKRQDQILRNFPTLVDLVALTVESGLDYLASFERILRNTRQHSPLEEELQKSLNEVQLGYLRREALRHFAQRTGIQELRSFVGLILQSDELGTSLVELLRNFAQDMRFRRLSRAERLASEASTKMLFPLFFFIFPTVFVLMFAPLLNALIKGGGLPF
ncbi:MAG: type II secretion system F family protein [Elusimicrobia bacterium]|nr:type II secretion system F family protein [Elusimicrobiota bacterium]